MTFLYIFIGLVIGAGLVFLIFRRRRKTGEPDENQPLLLIQNQLNELTRALNDRLAESTRLVGESLKSQFSESQKIIREVTRELTEVKETGKQVVSFAEQLQNLQDILQNPKQRGVLGEYYLETLLKNVLPPGTFQMQYQFRNGETVDAVVFVRDKIIPIDSKFSLENYNRLAEEKNPAEKERLEKNFINDLKLRVQETAKYIRPEEGTMDFAFMFIPHEAIYYDLLVNKIGAVSGETETMIQRAAGKYRVIVVAPTSFLAYLQTVLQGLKALEIEAKAKDIIKYVGELGRHLKSYEEYHNKLGNSLRTTVNQYNLSGREFKKIDKDILRINGERRDLEPLMIDRPEEGED